jgi:hypothetical protein
MALPDTFKLAASTDRSTGISTQGIADGASFTGSEIDNSVNRDTMADLEAYYTYSTAPTADKTVKIYQIYALDGTNYEEADAKNLIASFSPPDDTSNHRVMLRKGLPLSPHKFKYVAENENTGQQITLTLTCRTYNPTVED